MDCVTRADALTNGFRHYYTGLPCLRGHVSRRYVTNGACVDCLNEKAGREPVSKRTVARRPNLCELQIRVYDEDWPMIRATAHAFFRAAAPGLVPPADRIPRGRASGTAMHTVRVPDQYVQAMRETADAMFAMHRPDIAARRAEILRTVGVMADEHGTRPD